MKVLLDECCPRPLGALLAGHEVCTVERAALKGLENGDLLRAAEGRFDVLITADRNLRYQQNLASRRIAIIELPFNSWTRVRTLTPSVREALQAIQPGDYIELSPPPL